MITHDVTVDTRAFASRIRRAVYHLGGTPSMLRDGSSWRVFHTDEHIDLDRVVAYLQAGGRCDRITYAHIGREE